MKRLKFQLSLGIICILLGLMIAVQFKTVNAPKASVSNKRVEDLVKEVEGLTAQRDELQKKVAEAQKKVDELEKNAANSSTSVALLKEEVDNLRKLAGTTPVEGDGVAITLSIQDALNTNDVIPINEYDIIAIINELNAAQAEAISINGERYVARTSIRTAGAAMKINGNPYDMYKEFKIYAIGNPDVLYAALDLTGGVIDQLEERQIKVKISKEKNIKIPGISKNFETKYIK
ncbi:DUF881 domain-containing protein [Fonticella tunisiensis]|nr:DUF881 domain-containing protein [Fonticella tunisiensis]